MFLYGELNITEAIHHTVTRALGSPILVISSTTYSTIYALHTASGKRLPQAERSLKILAGGEGQREKVGNHIGRKILECTSLSGSWIRLAVSKGIRSSYVAW